MASDVCEAMKYLHSLDIIHRDLKSDNLLVSSDYRVKVSDFGVAKMLGKKSQRFTKHIGTMQWVAPEGLFYLVHSTHH